MLQLRKPSTASFLYLYYLLQQLHRAWLRQLSFFFDLAADVSSRPFFPFLCLQVEGRNPKVKKEADRGGRTDGQTVGHGEKGKKGGKKE